MGEINESDYEGNEPSVRENLLDRSGGDGTIEFLIARKMRF